MHPTIQLPDQWGVELPRAAKRHGVGPGEYAAQLIQANLPVAERFNARRSLFDEWSTEDATSDSAELAWRQQEWEQPGKS